jgi:hypothetical protein
MAGALGDHPPRLPPRTPPDSSARQLQLDLSTHEHRARQLEADWPPFQEPRLLSLKAARRIVSMSRLIAFAWAGAVVLIAIEAREGAHAGDQGAHIPVGRVGMGVAVTFHLAGWLWSDRATRNVHRLGGRRPNRLRCVSAWSLPLVWAALLTMMVVRMEPTDIVDVRPAIVVSLMAVTAWRPYSLVRRILTSLSRVRSDGLLGTAYVLDLSAFGLLWWQLATWPTSIGPADVERMDVIIGIASASAIGLGVNVAVWAVLAGDVERAQAHRLLALRTRHDHRNLRLRGIDPMDAEVRLALLRIRQDEELAWRAAAHETTDTAARSGHLEPRAAPPARAPAPSTGPTPDQLDPVVAEIVASDAGREIISELVGEIAASEHSADVIAALADEVASEVRSRTMAADLRGHFRSALDMGLARVRIEPTTQSVAGPGDDPVGSLLERLEPFGIRPRDGPGEQFAIPIDVEPEHDHRLIPPRLYRLEAIRYLLLIGIVALAASSAWIVSRSVSVGELPNGHIPVADLERINHARRAFVTALGISVTLVSIWCCAVADHARRAGMNNPRPRVALCYGLMCTAVLLNAVSLVRDADTRGAISLLCVFGSLGAALLAIAAVMPTVRWFERGTVGLVSWVTGLSWLVSLSWAGGLQRPVEATDAVGSLTFVAVLQAIVASVVTVLAALNTSDIEDAVRLSPVLAETPK